MPQVTFKQQPVKLEKTLVTKGSHLPSFSFTHQNLEDEELSQRVHDKLVLWFVPSLDTGVCILSAKKLNEHLKKHSNEKALILSTDLPFAQKRVCGFENLDHVTVVSLFRHHETLQNLGLMIAEGPLKGLSARCVIVLDSHHNITYMELVKELTDEPDYKALFHFLDH